MNREQRRKLHRAQAKAARELWPGGIMSVPEHSPLATGDKFTISGLKRYSDGRIDRHCAPGEETVWIARKR